MKSQSYSRSLAIRPTEAMPDTAAIQSHLNERLAHRWGVSVPVAAVLSGLAGIGPQVREAR